jgi:hypothetical protein
MGGRERPALAFIHPLRCLAWAAFHFRTERADQDIYLKIMDRALPGGRHDIIGTFAHDGPT